MSITIFASGKIDNVAAIPRLIEDLKVIAEERKWKYRAINDDFDKRADAVLAQSESGNPGVVIKGTLGLKGVVLSIGPGSEPLEILICRDGTLTGMMQQILWIESRGKHDRFTMCKTQFANIDAHVAIIELFDMLKAKYISSLLVNDEGGYWESRDRRLLAEKRILLDQYIRHTEKVISSIEVSEEDRKDPDRLVSGIEEALLKDDEEQSDV